jgi:TonB family protein
MRRIILTSLVLLPVMAYAQAGPSAAMQPSPSSVVNEAELTRPFAALAMKMPSKIAAAPARALIHESVRIEATQDFADAARMKGGALEFSMANTPTESAPPRLTRAVEVSLSNDELAEQAAVSNVVVHAVVDANGFPRNASVTRSGGRLVDQRAVEAVNQYRFVPATLGNKATWASVSIAIRIQKQ